MKQFLGFPTDRERLVPLPEAFFAQVLPVISHPLELRVLLHVFWRVWRTDRRPRCVSLSELLSDEELVKSLARVTGMASPKEAMLRGLEMCSVRGTLLVFSAQENRESQEQWVLVNTRYNRRWLRQVLKGQIQFPWHQEGASPAVIAQWQDTVFDIYEKNIGMLTPIVAEQLEQAVEEYSEEWVRQAISEAAGSNRRNWRFVRLLLERWKEEGRPGGADRQGVARPLDVDKYKRGKYSRFFGG